MGVPISRVIVFEGLYWGPPYFGKLAFITSMSIITVIIMLTDITIIATITILAIVMPSLTTMTIITSTPDFGALPLTSAATLSGSCMVQCELGLQKME